VALMTKHTMCAVLLLAAICVGQEVPDLLSRYEKEVQANPRSSISYFRIGEIHLQQSGFQPAANAFREALNGDLQPKWIEVWSHLNLGKIFDITGQRERALNEYRLALRTKDNTRGAIDEAEIYTQTPYPRK
jgi:tetratricopeptide (TPR) repeat protein